MCYFHLLGWSLWTLVGLRISLRASSILKLYSLPRASHPFLRPQISSTSWLTKRASPTWDLSPKLQTCLSSCVLSTPLWMSSMYLKLLTCLNSNPWTVALVSLWEGQFHSFGFSGKHYKMVEIVFILIVVLSSYTNSGSCCPGKWYTSVSPHSCGRRELPSGPCYDSHGLPPPLKSC